MIAYYRDMSESEYERLKEKVWKGAKMKNGIKMCIRDSCRMESNRTTEERRLCHRGGTEQGVPPGGSGGGGL